jgi:hypothetical protein
MSEIAPRRPFPVRGFVIAFVIILLLMWLPTISSMLAEAIAAAAGCKIFMGGGTPCPIAGLDWGGLLYAMDFIRYFIILTIPFFGFVLGIWLIWLLVALVRWARRPIAPDGFKGTP